MDETFRLRPRPRLAAAIEMLRGSDTVADIGCDHGRLACALVQQGAAKRCIAVDISEASLQKARRLLLRTGMSERVETRLGDGFAAVRPGEADAVALLGMGGTLMARLLERCDEPLNGARLAVFQPMRAARDIRRYLFERRCPILDDRVVLDGGRLYQIFCAGAPESGTLAVPADWPEDCFLLGYAAFMNRDPLTRALAEQMLAQREKRLATCSTPLLIQEAEQLSQILKHWARA